MNNGQSSVLPKLPPQSLDMEQSVLSAVLQDNQALVKVVDTLRGEDFYLAAHRWTFQAMVELFHENVPIDLLTVTERLKKQGRLEAVGGGAYLAELLDVVPTAAHIAYHAVVVREKAILRALIQTATTIVTQSYADTEDVAVLLDWAEQSIFEITQGKATSAFVNLSTILKGSFRKLEQLSERKELVTGVPTGFLEVDRCTAGLQPSDLIIIAGRPSMGKTALGLNIASHVGMQTGLPVAIFSLEMSKEQLALRMLCSEARVDSSKLRTGFIAREDWPILTQAAGKLSECHIYIDDTPAQSPLDIRAKLRRLQAEVGDLGLVIIDYLQLMQSRGRVESRQQEISGITRALKALAKEINAPVVALSQLSRAVEQRKPPKPQLSDLRESGAIEQDADVVALLYRDEFYNREESQEKGVAEVNIAKQRNGPTAVVRLAFHNAYTRFDNLAQQGDF